MTALDLQDELCKEIAILLDGWKYRTSTGQLIPMNIYKQNVPVPDSDEDPDSDPIPYVIVRLQNGDDEGKKDSFNVVNLVCIVGVMDNEPGKGGYQNVLNVFDKIYKRFQSKPDLNGKAVFTGEFHWACQEDNYYPYFFGGCSLSFNIPAIRREDPLS